MGISDTPRYWWDQAEEARSISELMSDLNAKRRMLEAADGCAHLAARADALLGRNRDADTRAHVRKSISRRSA